MEGKDDFFSRFGGKFNEMNDRYLTQMLDVEKGPDRRFVYEYRDHGLRINADCGYKLIVTVDSFTVKRPDNYIRFTAIKIGDDTYIDIDFTRLLFTNMLHSDYSSKIEDCLDMVSRLRTYQFGFGEGKLFIKIDNGSYRMLVDTFRNVFDEQKFDTYHKYLFGVFIAVCNRYSYNGVVGDLNMVFNKFGLPVLSEGREMGEYQPLIDEYGETIKNTTE